MFSKCAGGSRIAPSQWGAPQSNAWLKTHHALSRLSGGALRTHCLTAQRLAWSIKALVVRVRGAAPPGGLGGRLNSLMPAQRARPARGSLPRSETWWGFQKPVRHEFFQNFLKRFGQTPAKSRAVHGDLVFHSTR